MVKSGKWYFEFEAVTTGEMRVGWARPNVRPDVELGADDLAYVFNGHRVSKGALAAYPSKCCSGPLFIQPPVQLLPVLLPVG